jgi:imidazoleglycerol phosphate synthase glutamine amidotransferase subunit HisH
MFVILQKCGMLHIALLFGASKISKYMPTIMFPKTAEVVPKNSKNGTPFLGICVGHALMG